MDAETLCQLQYLAIRLMQEKDDENKARDRRVAIEEQIAVLIPGPDKGQKTVTLEDGTKITVERGFNYKADVAEIEKLFQGEWKEGSLGDAPIKVKTTRELDVKGYEWYRENDPEAFGLLARHVSVTPKKVSVSLKAGK